MLCSGCGIKKFFTLSKKKWETRVKEFINFSIVSLVALVGLSPIFFFFFSV